MTPLEDTNIEALKKYTTCDVSDALCKLDHESGGFLPGITMWSPERQTGTTKIVGQAYTIKYVRADAPEPKLESHYIDSLPEGCVIFISCPHGISNAVFGGLMATRARASGAVGTVIDGRFRDLQEQRDLEYPSIEIKSKVEPGDYLIADLNGVVVLPRSLVKEALILMEKQVAVDANMAVALKENMTFTEASQKYRV